VDGSHSHLQVLSLNVVQVLQRVVAVQTHLPLLSFLFHPQFIQHPLPSSYRQLQRCSQVLPSSGIILHQAQNDNEVQFNSQFCPSKLLKSVAQTSNPKEPKLVHCFQSFFS
jgi:hypothetical protein